VLHKAPREDANTRVHARFCGNDALDSGEHVGARYVAPKHDVTLHDAQLFHDPHLHGTYSKQAGADVT
jgi:hypothetical protein